MAKRLISTNEKTALFVIRHSGLAIAPRFPKSIKARNKMSGFSQRSTAGGRAAHAGNIFDSF
jgi:hypothetical protein